MKKINLIACFITTLIILVFSGYAYSEPTVPFWSEDPGMAYGVFEENAFNCSPKAYDGEDANSPDDENNKNLSECRACDGTGICRVCGGSGRDSQGCSCFVCRGTGRCHVCNGRGKI